MARVPGLPFAKGSRSLADVLDSDPNIALGVQVIGKQYVICGVRRLDRSDSQAFRDKFALQISNRRLRGGTKQLKGMGGCGIRNLRAAQRRISLAPRIVTTMRGRHRF
jgi:hypothetical protein